MFSCNSAEPTKVTKRVTFSDEQAIHATKQKAFHHKEEIRTKVQVKLLNG